MSRTQRGNKGPGYEYWSRRPLARKFGCPPGRGVKRETHKLERLEAKEEIRERLKEQESE